jgi:NAD(P)-dependent dehydrogenase (short-subunit alcohol dehydrogenase family)
LAPIDWTPDPDALRGRVAVVAGATRGAGRGIAAALGEAGATVVCTGRSSRTGSARSDYDRSETIEETAELVTSLGGTGIAEVVDHLDTAQVAALADRIRADHGHVDVLVNDIWGGEKLTEWDKPVWDHDLANGLRILRLAVDTHIITAHHLLPLMIDRRGGLHVEVTDGTLRYNAAHYRLNVHYDLAKVSVNRMAYSLGHELAPHGGTAVAVTPGWLRSEMMLEIFGVTEANWRESTIAPPGFAVSETPRFVGRAIVAMATDPDRQRWNQQSVDSGTLAKEYGFTDVDGSRPDVWRYMEDTEDGGNADPADYR